MPTSRGAPSPRPRSLVRAVLVVALVASPPAGAEELYLAANPAEEGTLVVIGVEDGTGYGVEDLESGAPLGAGVVDRGAADELDLAGVHRFALRADAPVLAYLGSDCCGVGGSTFVPTEDGHGMVGRAFLLYVPVLGVQSDLVVLAVEDASVFLMDLDGAVVGRHDLEAGRSWVAYPVVGERPYVVRASGDVALMVDAVNGLTAVPPASRLGSCDGDVGRRFLFATHSWGGGAAAVFAYEAATITISHAGLDDRVVEEAIPAGEWRFYSDLGRRSYGLAATGDVAVWAGDLEGGTDIEHMGDDFAASLGRGGLDVLFHSQSHGAALFATEDGSTLTLDGEPHELDAGEWVDVEPGLAGRVEATAPAVVFTFGGNTLNDWGGFLRPAPRGEPEATCPAWDGGLPDGDVGVDGDADADADGDADGGEPDGSVDGGGDGSADGAPSSDAAPPAEGPRPSCDCRAAGARATGPSRLLAAAASTMAVD